MPDFDCIYFLESAQFYVLEIKRNDCAENAPPSERFRWLRIEKSDLKVLSLTFQMMDAFGQIEERYFDEGFLKFNDIDGTYIEKYNAAQHRLERLDPTQPLVSLTEAIMGYLDQFTTASR